MNIRTIVSISPTIQTFLQSGNYEIPILDLMNTSKSVFPRKYSRIEKQPNNQCDYISEWTDDEGNKHIEKYDAKLPFDKKEGELLCSNQADFKKWLEFMMNEAAEFANYMIINRGSYSVKQLRLYKTLDKRISSLKEDEHGIIFFPYPITFDGEDMSFLSSATDILSAIYNDLLSEGKIGTRNIYILYPTIGNKIALRCMNTGTREYLCSTEISKHISFNISLT